MQLISDLEKALADRIAALEAEVARYRESLKKIARCTHISPWNEERPSYEANIAARALTDNPGNDTIATLYGALAQGQKRLGADFDAAWAANVDSLYDNSPGKEVMPDEASSARGSSDTAPAGLSAGGGAPVSDLLDELLDHIGIFDVSIFQLRREIDVLTSLLRSQPAPPATEGGA